MVVDGVQNLSQEPPYIQRKKMKTTFFTTPASKDQSKEKKAETTGWWLSVMAVICRQDGSSM